MVSTLINPVQGNNYLYNTSTSSTVNSKTFTNKYYNSPIYTEQQILYVPLQFPFTHYSNTYFPLLLLENKSIKLEILLRGTDHLYTIETFDKNYWYYDKIPDMSLSGYPVKDSVPISGVSGFTSRKLALDNTSDVAVSSPIIYGEQTTYTSSFTSPLYLKRYESRIRTAPSTTDNIDTYTYDGKKFNVTPTLEVEQIFLTEDERLQFKHYPNQLLIEQLSTKYQYNIKGNQTFPWIVKDHTNLIKELFIVVKRNDNKQRNQLFNYTNYDEASLTEEQVIKYQDNWWYDSIAASESSPETIISANNSITIKPDAFQEFLFRYGPYGEAQNENALGISGWPNKIEPQYNVYTIKEIDTFRKTWQYRKTTDIPKINKDNFNSTFKESPVTSIQILFDGMPREDIKDSHFYNKIQTYNYHTNNIDPGIYLYSFSLHPEEYQPSGFCNMNLFKRIQYKLTLSKTENKTGSTEKKYDYDITLYSLKYNFITIKDKQIQTAFIV
mgnify:CR=1 FL=1